MKPISELSRREFVALTLGGAAAAPFVLPDFSLRAAGPITAQEIVDRVKKNIGVEWSTDDVDTFKAGDPSTVVTGVVTTSMATLDVLQKAVQAGANLVITAAPTFYSRADLSTPGGRGLRRGRRGRGRAPAPGAGGGPGAGARPVAGDGQRSGHRRVGAHAAGARRCRSPSCRRPAARRAGGSSHAPAAGSGLRRQERRSSRSTSWWCSD